MFSENPNLLLPHELEPFNPDDFLADWVKESLPLSESESALQSFNKGVNLSNLGPIINISKQSRNLTVKEIQNILESVIAEDDLTHIFAPFLKWGVTIVDSSNPELKIDDQIRRNFTALICKSGQSKIIEALVIPASYIGAAKELKGKRAAVKDILSTKCTKAIKYLASLKMPNAKGELVPLFSWYIQTPDHQGVKRAAVKDILSTQFNQVLESLESLKMLDEKGELVPLFSWYIKMPPDEAVKRAAVKDILSTQCNKVLESLESLKMLDEKGELVPLFSWYIKMAPDEAVKRAAVKDILSSRCRKLVEYLNNLEIPNAKGELVPLFSWYIQSPNDQAVQRAAVKDILSTECNQAVQYLNNLEMPNAEGELVPLFSWYIQTPDHQAVKRAAVKDILSTKCSKAIEYLDSLKMPNAEGELVPLFSWYIQTPDHQALKRAAVQDILLSKCNKVIRSLESLKMLDAQGQPTVPLFHWYINVNENCLKNCSDRAIRVIKSMHSREYRLSFVTYLKSLDSELYTKCKEYFTSEECPKTCKRYAELFVQKSDSSNVSDARRGAIRPLDTPSTLRRTRKRTESGFSPGESPLAHSPLLFSVSARTSSLRVRDTAQFEDIRETSARGFC